jgi:hypothetical protein
MVRQGTREKGKGVFGSEIRETWQGKLLHKRRQG